MLRVRLIGGFAVKGEVLVRDVDASASNTYHALDEGLLWVNRIPEYDQVATLDIAHKRAVQSQEMVALVDGRLHARGRHNVSSYRTSSEQDSQGEDHCNDEKRFFMPGSVP